jgi:PAS domain S-box-containing protein
MEKSLPSAKSTREQSSQSFYQKHNPEKVVTDNVRILVIDDDEDDFFITSEYIRKIKDANFQIDWCFRYQDAMQKLKEHLYDIYFVDYYLGAKTGLQLIKEACNSNCEEPMVLLTGKGNQAIDREAMQAGAMDYLIKSELNEEKLERCIRYSLERARSLKALKANERKFRSLFESSKDAVFIADIDLHFKDVNNATSGLTGFNKQELLEKEFCSLLDEAECDYVLSQLQVSNEIKDREIEICTQSGEKKTCILFLSKEWDIEGNFYIHGILHDITELKKAEKATLQAEKLAATGRLVQTLAHEVRNPLNNINLSVEQLSHELDPAGETQIYMEIIQRNSKRIGDIITELLNSSRPAEMSFQKVILQEVMDGSIFSALDRITLQKVNLQVRYSDEPAYILGDTSKLKIAFLNIIINAVEAMQEEIGQLSISIASDGLKHTVKISDNGTGITEENLTKLFEPYFTSKRNGLGLGLASTLNILQAHKAHIDVSSAINKGTYFTISFPNAAMNN